MQVQCRWYTVQCPATDSCPSNNHLNRQREKGVKNSNKDHTVNLFIVIASSTIVQNSAVLYLWVPTFVVNEWEEQQPVSEPPLPNLWSATETLFIATIGKTKQKQKQKKKKRYKARLTFFRGCHFIIFVNQNGTALRYYMRMECRFKEIQSASHAASPLPSILQQIFSKKRCMMMCESQLCGSFFLGGGGRQHSQHKSYTG